MIKNSKKNTASYIEAAKEVKMAPIQLLHEIRRCCRIALSAVLTLQTTLLI